MTLHAHARLLAEALLLAGFWLPATAGSEHSVQYNRDIRPLLAENCFPCHGADAAARKAHLRLDQPATTAASVDVSPVLIPGRPTESEVIRRILADDEDDRMPPADSHKVLTSEQKQLLQRWVQEGAEYQPHWAFIAPNRPQPPAIRNTRWVRNSVDQFILARLESEKLKPAPEADRRALARRLSLDLIGLPPEPELVEAFVEDKDPNAYERLVDLLMASPHWGEHRARYWLDVARYGDTHGIHFDNYREVWAYRDWVINAFNNNLPFDQFTVEQLAGDLLPAPTCDQKIATGFNRCNITTSEGGAIDEEYLVLYTRDRTETTAQAWLGLTASCAVCHDHKYDPLSQKEFYELAAFFNNTIQKAMDENIKDTPPVIVVPAPEDVAHWDELILETNAVHQRMDQREKAAWPEFVTWQANPAFALPEKRIPVPALFRAMLNEGSSNLIVQVNGEDREIDGITSPDWREGVTAELAVSLTNGSPFALEDVGDFSRDEAFSFAAWIWLEEGTNGAVLARMSDRDGKHRGWDLWLADAKPAVHLIHEWPDNALKITAKEALPLKSWQHVCVTYDGSSKAGGLKIYVNGVAQKVTIDKDGLNGDLRTESHFKLGQRDTTSKPEQLGLQDVQIHSRKLNPEEVLASMRVPRLQWLATKPIDAQGAEECQECYAFWLEEVDAPYRDERGSLETLHATQKEIRDRGTIAHVMHEKDTLPEAHVLFRGEYDQRRERVRPGTPGMLPPMDEALARDRLGLAQWLLEAENPLTARVTVNRFWQELFGTGLVRSAGDFGLAGEVPSHPELLDWLAVEFRESGWDVKHLFKLLVMSATYRQSAAVTGKKLARDPDNRLLSRGPRFRMDAEMVRDHALAASGLLVPTIGGPSVRPYQPDGVWEAVAMPESDTRFYKRDSGDKLYRRSVYTFWKRAAPPASMEIFNAPNRETCTVRRDRTSTPLQALVTLNDPQFVEAARRLAQMTLQQGDLSVGDHLDFMAERLIARPLSKPEQKIMEAGLRDLLEHYQGSPETAAALLKVGESPIDASLDPATLAAYTMAANTLMNLDEVLNK